jgi:1,2-diacylglycerol 3-beta-galactosyltransferase
MTVALFDTMRRVIHDNSPDLIITTYPLYLAPLDAVFTLNQRYVPVFTIITDMVSVHRLWFNGVSAMTYVATDAVKNMGVNFGIREEQISITGIPVHPGVSAESRDKTAIRKELGWDPTLKTILAVASRRVGHMWETLRLINHSNLSIQLVITAGGDLELYNEALYTDWHQPTHLYNFVDQMPTFMHAADAIICKAGGLITTEALACGLPILLVDVLPGQEEGNAQIVVDGGAGDWPESPIDALETVYHWLMNDGALLKERAGNAAKLGRPQSAVQIAREVWEALESENCTRKDYRILDIPTFSDLLDRFDIPWREALSGNLFRSSD